jgi:GAF domain-containing protein
MGELFEAHHAIILLLEPDGETLRVVGQPRLRESGHRRPRPGRDRGRSASSRRSARSCSWAIWGSSAPTPRPSAPDDEGRTGSEIGDVVPVPGLPNAESQIAIPLLIRDELVGVFSIESPVRQAFDAHDRSLATIVANQIASAIRNAQLYDERRRAADALQAANASLEARVAERTAALQRELRIAEDLLQPGAQPRGRPAPRRERRRSCPARRGRRRGDLQVAASPHRASRVRQRSGGSRPAPGLAAQRAHSFS